MNPSDKRQISSADRLAKKIDKLYQLLIREVGRISADIKDFDPEKPFDFNKYPKIKKQINKLLKEFSVNAIDIINQATEQEWNQAVKKNNDIITPYLKRKLLTKEQIAAYTNRNTEALRAFQERKTDGLDLSDRIWKYTQQFRNEIEMSLDLGLSDGRSAQQISRDIRQYLNEPNLLFRRVRDKHGNLHLSKRAKDYNPGKGIYRSSYKNAMRVVRTEVNMAYRASDMEKYQQLDFVLGYEVKRSNNIFGCSVCESLKGKYPKDFVFLGWHPQCRCYTVPILQKVDDFIKELQGEDTEKEYITDVPDNFKQWVNDNKERIDNAQSLPLWLKDNKAYAEKTLRVSEKMKRYNETPFKELPIKGSGKLEVFSKGRQNGQEESKNTKVLTILAENGYHYRLLPVIEDGNKNPDAFNLITEKFVDIKVTESDNGKSIIQNTLKDANKQGVNEVIIEFTKELQSNREAFETLKATFKQKRAKNIETIIFVMFDKRILKIDTKRFK